MRVRIALALALVAIATGLAIDMSGAAPRLAGGNDARWPAPAFSDVVPGGGVGVRTAGTTLPADAARMVMTIGSYGGRCRVWSGDFTPTVGGLGSSAERRRRLSGPSGFDTARSTSRAERERRRLSAFERARTVGVLRLGPESADDGQRQTSERRRLDPLYRAGSESWWQLLGALDLRFGLGKWGFFGDWTLPAIALAALLLWFGVARVLVRDVQPANGDAGRRVTGTALNGARRGDPRPRRRPNRRSARRDPAWARAALTAWRRIPRAGRACFLIAFANIAIWTVVIPPFQVPDEISHFAYAQYLAETGAPPPQTPGAAYYSPQENAATLGWIGARRSVRRTNRGVFTAPEDRELRQVLGIQRRSAQRRRADGRRPPSRRCITPSR